MAGGVVRATYERKGEGKVLSRMLRRRSTQHVVGNPRSRMRYAGEMTVPPTRLSR
jgi:hypothetical protein